MPKGNLGTTKRCDKFVDYSNLALSQRQLPSLSSPPFPLHSLTLISLPLAYLDSLPPMIWYSGQTALFLFLLARAAPAFLPTALSVALRPLFPFRQAQYVPVLPLKPAPFCTLLAGLGSTNKSSTFLLLLSDSRSVLSSIFPLISNSVTDLAGTVFSLFLFYQTTMGPRTLVSPGERRSLPDGKRYLRPPQSLSSYIHSSLFSDWRRTVSSKFFDTQVPSISTEELVLPRQARCVLSRLRCNGHSLLLGSYLSRIGKIENPSYSACGHSSQDTSLSHSALSSYGLSTPLTLCLSTTSGPDLGELTGFWGSIVSRHAPISRKGSGNQQQQGHLKMLHKDQNIYTVRSGKPTFCSYRNKYKSTEASVQIAFFNGRRPT